MATMETMATMVKPDEGKTLKRNQFKSIVSGLIRDPRTLHRLSIADVCSIMREDPRDKLIKNMSELKMSSNGVDSSTEIPIITVSDFSMETDRTLLPDTFENCRKKSYYERLMTAGENKNYLKVPGYEHTMVKHKSFDSAYMYRFRKSAHVKPSSFSTYFTSERKDSPGKYKFQRRFSDSFTAIKNKYSIRARLKLTESSSLMPNQIYRLEETKLYWRSLPSRKLEGTNLADSSHRDRLTVLFCTNFNGTHRLKPLVVGSTRDQRVIRNFEAFVIYRYSKDAQITGKILNDWFFEHFVLEVSENLKSQGLPPRGLLCLDPSVSRHPPPMQLISDKYKIKTIKLFSKVDVDKSVVGLARIEYKKLLLLDAVACPNKFTKLSDAVAIIRIAWDKVKPFDIEKCCRYTFPISEDKCNFSDCNPTALLRSMQLQNISKMEIQGLLSFFPGGNDLAKSEIDNWIYFDHGYIINKNPFF